MQVRRWLPDQPTRIGRHDWPDEGDNGTHMRLRAGSIVVLDRQAWRILEINGYTGDRWPDSYEKAWRDHVELWWHANELRRANNQAVKPAPERAEFYKRPVILVLRNENLPRSTPKHWCAPASHDWQVLPEHYAVCRACGELPPCRHGEYRWEGGPRWPEQNGGIPLMVPEYCCMGCAEPIRPRMRTVRFPGPNLWYPDLGEDTAVFHARTACADQVDCYRVQWQTEYDPRSSAHSAAVEFPGFEQFVLPRTRNAPDVAPHGQSSGAVPAGPPAPADTEPAHQPAHQPAPAAEAPVPAVEGAGPALRAAEELGLSLAERPAFHNAEQAARVIEELTAAVRNIALCLNDPAARARP